MSTSKEKNSKSKAEKSPKRKPKYGMFSCVAYMYKILWKYERTIALAGIFTVPLSVAASALALYTPSIVLRYLESAGVFSTIGLIILGLMLADLALSLANNVIKQKSDLAEMYIIMRLQHFIYQEKLDKDYYLNFDPDYQNASERAFRGLQSNHTRAVHFPFDFADMAAAVLKFFLFGSIITMLNPWIILLLAAGCAINYACSAWRRKREYETRDDRNKIEKKIRYLTFSVAGNFNYGKEIRLYNMRDCLSWLSQELFGQSKAEKEKQERRGLAEALAGFLVVLIKDGAAYAFLISRAATGEIDAAQFVLYFSAITEMSSFMSNILSSWAKISEGALQISDYHEFFDIPDKLNRGKGIPLPKGAFSIEFKDVSYTYPKGEKKVLDHISFKINAGEKLALVGLNGAGKTTLTMLMCGLLLPTEGQILLDGHELYEYNRDEMYSLFGLVPQKFNLLPISIARNITCTKTDEEIDAEKLQRCIKLAGLEEKIASLPMGADSPLNRQLNQDGIELSGGETQKLLLARLLYRSPKCIILDEPTAALDPIAEDQMYRKYNEITDGATSVFISHRLASTRFCDRILLLDGAVFAESGTHEELMAAGGKYRELFDVQSKYYKEGTQHEN